MDNRILTIAVCALLLGACTKRVPVDNDTQMQSGIVNFTLKSAAVNDVMAINQDDTFSSLALYIYNDDAPFTLENVVLLPTFTSVNAKDIALKVPLGTKHIYLIANYAGKTFKRSNGVPFTLNITTSKQELDDMIVESGGGLLPNSLLMVANKTVTLGVADNGSVINLALRRLQARVDVHIYKGANFGSNVVTLESVTLHNQVLNSEVKFNYTPQDAQMLTSPMFAVQSVANNSVLIPYAVGTVLQPVDAEAIFYSYQNLVTVHSPVQVTAPYIEIVLNVSGNQYTYKGYLTDADQLINKYSMLQNNVYQITAVLDAESIILLNLSILPWNKTEIDYNRPITASDFTFGAWGSSWGGINGKTMNTNVGGIEDAVFQFELKAPEGATWSATLTNGLEFMFPTTSSGVSGATVTGGCASVGSPYIIAVRAAKRWTGEARDTEFYITVRGKEVPINPIVGSQRLYEGTETRIKIKQVASYLPSISL